MNDPKKNHLLVFEIDGTSLATQLKTRWYTDGKLTMEETRECPDFTPQELQIEIERTVGLIAPDSKINVINH